MADNDTVPEAATTRLLVDRRDGDVVLVTLNRPEARNAVSFEMWEAFSTLLDRLERDTPARALIITGAGGHFSYGGDMKIPPARGDGALAAAARLEWGQRIIARLRSLPIPVIAAVEGGAYGIGWSLALAADLIIAAEGASFGAPFVNFGLTPDGGAAWLLGRQIGRYQAAELILSARTLPAAEALGMGLVSRLCPTGTALDTALDFAAKLGNGNRQAVELSKRLLHNAEGSNLEASHALELVYCAHLQGGDELRRARDAFINARKQG